MTDETTTQQPEANATSGMTVEEVEAKRNAKALETAKAGGYVAPAAPSIAERVNALVDGVQHAMNHNAPISREHFAEMKDLLGYRNPEPAQGDQAAV